MDTKTNQGNVETRKATAIDLVTKRYGKVTKVEWIPDPDPNAQDRIDRFWIGVFLISYRDSLTGLTNLVNVGVDFRGNVEVWSD